MTIKVVISGINGRMGRFCARLLHEDPQFQLVGAFDKPDAPCIGQDAGTLTIGEPLGVLVSKSIEEIKADVKPDVLLDFSIAEPAVKNAQAALNRGIRSVIGTSGIPAKDVETLSQLATSKRLGAIVVPNFSVGAVLMMEFARQAGAFFENVEIVEMHHTKKLDAPSGTAMHTVGKLESNNKEFNPIEVEEHELLANSRGGRSSGGVRVHSLRLPGLISHQEVIFGGPGELLTIRHDSFNTDCFGKGIKMALKAVMDVDHLIVGLDKLLNLGGSTATEREKIGGRAS